MPQLPVPIPVEGSPRAWRGNPSSNRSLSRARVALCSRVRGRERWYVPDLENNPRLAAAVELVLRSEDGIQQAQANPVTGRVLVHFRPDSVSESIDELIRHALDFGPMSRDEYQALSSNRTTFSLKHVFAAEIGCTALKMTLLGGCCPTLMAAAALLFLFHSRR